MARNPQLSEELKRRRAALDAEREPVKATWLTTANHVLAQKVRFLHTREQQRKSTENTKIVDPRGSIAALRLAALFASGLTSPSRPWKRLTTSNPNLRDSQPVREWLAAVDRRMDAIFARSNVYKVLPHLYFDDGVFATAAGLFTPRLDGKVIRGRPSAIGTYWLAQDADGVVDTYYDERPATTRQLESMFGSDALPAALKSDTGRQAIAGGESTHQLCHAIEPNPDYQPDSFDPARKRYRSVWFLNGHGHEVLGDVSGYDLFPVLAPRWTVYGEDVYGSMCPGMLATPELRALMHQQRRKAQWIDKAVTPPTQSPASMQRTTVSLVAGANNYVPDTTSGAKIEPIYRVDRDASWLLQDIGEIKQSVEELFYNDLLLLINGSDNRQMTATEVAERHEEKLLLLSPVLEQLQDDLLAPLVDLTWEAMLRDPRELEALPPLPGQLEGEEIRVEYVSILSQAQQAVGTRAIERTWQFAGAIAGLNPSVVDKLDADDSIDEYGAMLGVPPGIIVSDEVVARVRRDREIRAAQKEAEERALQRAETAKRLGQADVGSDTALGLQADELVGVPHVGGSI